MSLRSTLSDIADAIRSKTGKTDLMTPAEMAQEIADIDTGGDLDGLLSGTITEIDSAVPLVRTGGARECADLETVRLTDAVTIGPGGFFQCTSLQSVDAPALTQTADSAVFSGCTALVDVNMPALVTMGNSCFVNDHSIPGVTFPALETIGQNSFYSCSALAYVDMTAIQSIGYNAFGGCTALATMIIRGDRVPTLTSDLSGTQIGYGNGYIYVPTAMIAQYQQATNWSLYSAQFRALEDYTVDGTTTGELDQSKI